MKLGLRLAAVVAVLCAAPAALARSPGPTTCAAPRYPPAAPLRGRDRLPGGGDALRGRGVRRDGPVRAANDHHHHNHLEHDQHGGEHDDRHDHHHHDQHHGHHVDYEHDHDHSATSDHHHVDHHDD